MMHLVAGVGALGMGVAVLIHGGRARARNRAFAMLCAALVVWNLAMLARAFGPGWRPVYLLGGCSAAPLGLNFALAIAGRSAATRRRATMPALVAALALWVASWFDDPFVVVRWNVAAIGVLTTILAVALVVVAAHALSRPPGVERRSLLYVLGGSTVAVVGGMTDFVSRDQLVGWTRLGPLAVLVFLLVVCIVLVRYRFLDVDLALGHLVTLLAVSAIAASLFYLVVREVGGAFVALFVTSAIVLAVAIPLGHARLTQSRRQVRASDPLARALLETSRRIPRAISADEVWRTIEDGRRLLPGAVRIDVYMRRSHQDRFHLHFRAGPGDVEASPVHRDAALPRMLERERLPLTRWNLEQERLDAEGEGLREIDAVLSDLDRLDLHLVAPFYFRDRMGGWFALGGEFPTAGVTHGLISEFLAVTNQAAAALSRIEAMEHVRRNEALAAIGELAAGLAHEVRNPLAAIRGAAQAIGPRATALQQREMLEVIEEETGRLGRVVGDFLDYARPGLRRREPVDLGALAHRVAQASSLAGRDLTIEIHADPPPAPALGDPDQLYRVFENLVRNAWEATGDGGTLRIELSTVRNDRVAVRFEDDGPGIALEDTHRLFDPFHTGKPGGTGLGLALVHRIVEAHHGEISVEGRPGVGAAFTIVLPAAGNTDASPGPSDDVGEAS